MSQDRQPTEPSRQDQTLEKDRVEKRTVSGGSESDPRSELGLKSPVEESEGSSNRSAVQEAQGQKATKFDGNPNPQGAPSSPLKPEDDTPTRLGKESRNDQ